MSTGIRRSAARWNSRRADEARSELPRSGNGIAVAIAGAPVRDLATMEGVTSAGRQVQLRPVSYRPMERTPDAGREDSLLG
jgi:hypothetical protein